MSFKKMQSGEPNQQDDAPCGPSLGGFRYKADRPKKVIPQQALSGFAQKLPQSPASALSLENPPASSDQSLLESSSPDILADTLITVGEILGSYGVVGQIKVLPYVQQKHGQSALLHADRWQIVRDGQMRTIEVLQVRAHNQDTLVAKIPGCTQREEAQALRGWAVQLYRSQFPKLEQGEYYWVDLIGLDAVTPQGVPLGTVVGLLENSAHAVLRIAPATPAAEKEENGVPKSAPQTTTQTATQMIPSGKKSSKSHKAPKRAQPEILIPFVNAFVGDICWKTRTIEIDWDLESV